MRVGFVRFGRRRHLIGHDGRGGSGEDQVQLRAELLDDVDDDVDLRKTRLARDRRVLEIGRTNPENHGPVGARPMVLGKRKHMIRERNRSVASLRADEVHRR